MKPISAAAAAKRDDARTTDGQFGVQPHDESGEVVVDQLPDFLDGDGWTESRHPNWKMYSRTTGAGVETVREFFNGIRLWELDGMAHRVGAPAMTTPNGAEEYFEHGLKHRGDGPAIDYKDGHEECYLYGVKVPESAMCTVTPDQVVDHMLDVGMASRLAKFNGWTTMNSDEFGTQIALVVDAIRHLDTYRDAAPVTTFPAGIDYGVTIGFMRNECAVSQLAIFEHLSDDPDAKGVDQARAMAAGILNFRNKVAARFFTK